MYILIILFIIGSAIGSFLNVVICRLPEKRSIVKGRSCCPHCKTNIRPKDLVPLFSFLFLKGKCRDCQTKISWQYPILELLTGLLFVFVGYFHGVDLNLSQVIFYRDLVFVSALIIIFFTDLKYYLLFPAVMVPLMFFALIVNTFIFAEYTSILSTLSDFALAGAIAGGFFWLQHKISKGKWVGDGDIYLGFLAGFMLGLPGMVLALFSAYFIGAFVSGFLLALQKKNMKSAMPFGVFLSLGIFIALFWGNQIISWYLNLL